MNKISIPGGSNVVGSLILFLSVSSILAEVEAVTIAIGRGSDAPAGIPTNYTVAAGKVLIINSVQFITTSANISAGDSYRIQIYEKVTGLPGTILTYVDAGTWAQYKRNTFDVPIRVIGGSLLGSNATYGWYLFKGFLVDSTDLYANLDVELIDPRVENGKLMAEAKVSSPRPHRLRVQSSEDLEAFQIDATATVDATSDPATSTVAIETDGSPAKFMRVIDRKSVV